VAPPAAAYVKRSAKKFKRRGGALAFGSQAFTGVGKKNL
jgi:hypothetical protein